MKLTAEREKLLTPLQAVIGVVERRQTMPVLANVLLSVRQGRLTITATDLEVELVAATEVGAQTSGDITVPGRKLLDILRALPEKMPLTLNSEGEKVVIKAGRSRFSLSTLPAADFPVVEDIHAQQTVHHTFLKTIARFFCDFGLRIQPARPAPSNVGCFKVLFGKRLSSLKQFQHAFRQ